MPPIIVPSLKSAKNIVKRLVDTETAFTDSTANGWVTGVGHEAFGVRLIGHVRALRLRCLSLPDRPFFVLAEGASTQAPLSLLGGVVRERIICQMTDGQQPIDVSWARWLKTFSTKLFHLWSDRLKRRSRYAA
jgi:hypothetical protein